MPQTVGGALAQLDTGELVLPGDEAILLLTSRPELAPHYQAVPAAGIYFVRPMGVVPEHSNAFGLSLNGQPVDLFVARVRALVR